MGGRIADRDIESDVCNTIEIAVEGHGVFGWKFKTGHRPDSGGCCNGDGAAVGGF